MKEKIDSFISDPNAGTLTGERRMGTDALLDMLAERLAEQDEKANIIRVKGTDEPLERIRSEMKEGINHILLYDRISNDDLNSIVEEFPGAFVYRGQELCHQVPACVKVSQPPR